MLVSQAVGLGALDLLPFPFDVGPGLCVLAGAPIRLVGLVEQPIAPMLLDEFAQGVGQGEALLLRNRLQLGVDVPVDPNGRALRQWSGPLFQCSRVCTHDCI